MIIYQAILFSCKIFQFFEVEKKSTVEAISIQTLFKYTVYKTAYLFKYVLYVER